MKLQRLLISIPLVLFNACDGPSGVSQEEAGNEGLFVKVDGLQQQVADNIADLEPPVVIDHARLAQKEDVKMPPSVVTIFSDPAINSPLMKVNPRLGLDLPHKILAFAGTDGPATAFANADFLSKRHGIRDDNLFAAYQKTLDGALAGIPNDLRSAVNTETLTADYGIVELESGYPFDETVERLKEAVLAQGDTVWFGEVDYRKDAALLGIEIPEATLLLFGGPAPGGKAMAEFPMLGLDAFCQKLLVYRDPAGTVKVIFNDIVALAELHYGKSNIPQKVINVRLKKTFTNAIGNDN